MLSNAISYLIKKIAIYWYKLIKKIGKKLKYISSLCEQQRLILSYYHYIKIISNIVNAYVKWSNVCLYIVL